MIKNAYHKCVNCGEKTLMEEVEPNIFAIFPCIKCYSPEAKREKDAQNARN